MLQNSQRIASSLSTHSSMFREFSGSTALANKEIVRAIHEISAGAEQQAQYTELSSTTINELDEQVRDIAKFTDTMQRKSREAAINTHTGSESMEELQSAARRSEEVLHHVYQAMETLSRSSAQIARIVGTISDISTQTNVLALNAAIEAARAGVHGKGFSVIAEEVRLLSGQTNDSSKTIAVIVKSLMTQIKELEATLGEAKQSFEQQKGKMSDSLAAFQEIRQSMDELSSHIGQIHSRIAAAEDKKQPARSVDPACRCHRAGNGCRCRRSQLLLASAGCGYTPDRPRSRRHLGAGPVAVHGNQQIQDRRG